MPLRAYVVFVLVVFALSSSMFYAPSLDAAIVPYTGWLGLYVYTFTLFFAIAAILTPQRKTIYAVVAFLGLFMLFGALDTYQNTLGPDAGREDFGNPYLIYQTYRPVFTIGLPAFWLLLLVSPTMRKWINNSDQRTASSQP
jgi:hypothetical protein